MGRSGCGRTHNSVSGHIAVIGFNQSRNRRPNDVKNKRRINAQDQRHRHKRGEDHLLTRCHISDGFQALDGVDLEIKDSEILALLGPNGAGKTTLISIICGISSLTTGKIQVGGYDVESQYRKAREMIGLVPQEIALEPFETVMNSIRFSRGLFGKPKNED